MKTSRTITVKATIETPTIPNFVKQANGGWLPLCAIDDDGLEELGDAWIECLKARAKEQQKDANKFYTMAAKEN